MKTRYFAFLLIVLSVIVVHNVLADNANSSAQEGVLVEGDIMEKSPEIATEPPRYMAGKMIDQARSVGDCDFEEGLCRWTQSTDDTFDWTLKHGRAPSSMTGPTVDHTTETQLGQYLYIESSSPRREGDTARIESPWFGPGEYMGISFYYHMYGIDINTLTLYIRTRDWNETVVWSLSGDQGNEWRQAKVGIFSSKEYQLVFEAVRGKSWKGDIAIDDVMITGAHRATDKEVVKRHAVIATEENTWPNNTVFYEMEMDPPLEDKEKKVFESALEAYAESTCINLVYSTDAPYRVKIVRGGGCSSFRGRRPEKYQPQIMQLNKGCIWHRKKPMHEFMHALGVIHEMNRPDRDDYVRINMDNVNDNQHRNFNKEDADSVSLYHTDYSFESVMHYGRTFFAKDPYTNTIITLDPDKQNVIGQALDFSFEDKQLLNRMYPCKCGADAPVCAGHSYLGPDCQCQCKQADLSSATCDPCFEPGIACECQENGCDTVPHSTCSQDTKACECDVDYVRIGIHCVHPSNISCPAVGVHCHCSLNDPSACKGRDENSVCNTDTDRCECSAGYSLQSGVCVDASTVDCSSLGQSCFCSAKSQTECNKNVDLISVCDQNTDSCVCPGGFINNNGTCEPNPPRSVGDCDFEEGLCHWTQSADDKFDWILNHGRTPSSTTGPEMDHTRVTKLGHFLFIESSSPRREGDTARIESPWFGLGENMVISFYYHMYGIDIDTLTLYIRTRDRNEMVVWSLSGNQGKEWRQAKVDIVSSEAYQLVFEAVRGKSWKGDIAIDDIMVTGALGATDRGYVSDGEFLQPFILSPNSMIPFSPISLGDNSGNGWLLIAKSYNVDDIAVFETDTIALTGDWCVSLGFRLKSAKVSVGYSIGGGEWLWRGWQNEEQTKYFADVQEMKVYNPSTIKFKVVAEEYKLSWSGAKAWSVHIDPISIVPCTQN